MRVKKPIDIKPYLFLVPSFVMIIAFLYYPLSVSIGYSFTDWTGLGPLEFAGVENYIALFHSEHFWLSVRLTFVWVIMSVVILPMTGLFLGVIVEYIAKTKLVAGITRTILFMPMMMSMVSVGLLWTLIYNPLLGLLNNGLSMIGLMDMGNPMNWLGNVDLAIYFAFVPAIWQWSGFGMVLICAAMMNIPSDVLEAAEVDGASKFKQFRSVVFPLLLPTLMVAATLNMIGGFRAFDLIRVMTAGGPGNATRVTSIFIFNTAFVENRLGLASAASMILFVLIVFFSIIFIKIMNKANDYTGR